MNVVQKKLAVVLCIMMALLSACNSSTSNNTGGNNAENSRAAQQSAASPAFEMYSKINIGMSKDQVDAALGTAPVVQSHSGAPDTYNYRYKDSQYGVSVIYNEQNVLYSKTVMYNSSKDLAPMTPKPVTREQQKSITNGMTSEEVMKILGGDGIECSATAMPNDMSKVGLLKRWVNSDGSHIQISFTHDGKVAHCMYYSSSR